MYYVGISLRGARPLLFANLQHFSDIDVFFAVECECMAAAVLLLDVCGGEGKEKMFFIVQ